MALVMVRGATAFTRRDIGRTAWRVGSSGSGLTSDSARTNTTANIKNDAAIVAVAINWEVWIGA